MRKWWRCGGRVNLALFIQPAGQLIIIVNIDRMRQWSWIPTETRRHLILVSTKWSGVFRSCIVGGMERRTNNEGERPAKTRKTFTTFSATCRNAAAVFLLYSGQKKRWKSSRVMSASRQPPTTAVGHFLVGEIPPVAFYFSLSDWLTWLPKNRRLGGRNWDRVSEETLRICNSRCLMGGKKSETWNRQQSSQVQQRIRRKVKPT